MEYVIIAFLLAFIIWREVFYWLKEKEWYARYSDLLDRKSAGDFYNYALYKQTVKPPRVPKHTEEPQLFAERIEAQLQEAADKTGDEVPTFINQRRPGGVTSRLQG